MPDSVWVKTPKELKAIEEAAAKLAEERKYTAPVDEVDRMLEEERKRSDPANMSHEAIREAMSDTMDRMKRRAAASDPKPAGIEESVMIVAAVMELLLESIRDFGVEETAEEVIKIISLMLVFNERATTRDVHVAIAGVLDIEEGYKVSEEMTNVTVEWARKAWRLIEEKTITPAHEKRMAELKKGVR